MEIKSEDINNVGSVNNDIWLSEWTEATDKKETKLIKREIKDQVIDEEVSLDDDYEVFSDGSETEGNPKYWTETEDIKEDTEQLIGRTQKAVRMKKTGTDSAEVKAAVTATSGQLLPVHPSNFRKKKADGKYLDDLIEKLCINAPVSQKVLSLCQLKCPNCPIVTNCWISLKRHLLNTHNQRYLPYADVGQLLLKKVSHVCKICSKRVLCDGTFIQWHVFKKHRLGKAEYVKKFGLVSSWRCTDGTYSENTLGNFCRYKCNDCGQEYVARASMRKHLWEKHRSKSPNSEWLAKRDFHKCKMCDATILCELVALRRHFRVVHDITLEGYCMRTGCTLMNRHPPFSKSFLKTLKLSRTAGNLCVFICKTCNMSFKASSTFKSHMKRDHPNLSQSVAAASVVKGFSFKCEQCSGLMLCDKKVIDDHSRTRHNRIFMELSAKNRRRYEEVCNDFRQNTPKPSKVWDTKIVPVSQIPLQEQNSKIGNLCIFKCLNCQKMFTNYLELEKHRRDDHGLGMHFSPSIVVKARYHACLLCPRAFLSDRNILRAHLRGHHRKGLQDYERTFQQNGGEVLPTYSNWLATCDNTKNMTIEAS